MSENASFPKPSPKPYTKQAIMYSVLSENTGLKTTGPSINNIISNAVTFT